MDKLLRVLKALSNDNRIRIIKVLQEKSLCVCELGEILNISQPAVSRHLNKLKDAGLLIDKKEGIWINYRLNNTSFNKYASLMLDILKKLINDDEIILKDRTKLKEVDREKICREFRCI